MLNYNSNIKMFLEKNLADSKKKEIEVVLNVYRAKKGSERERERLQTHHL